MPIRINFNANGSYGASEEGSSPFDASYLATHQVGSLQSQRLSHLGESPNGTWRTGTEETDEPTAMLAKWRHPVQTCNRCYLRKSANGKCDCDD